MLFLNSITKISRLRDDVMMVIRMNNSIWILFSHCNAMRFSVVLYFSSNAIGYRIKSLEK